MRVIEGIYYLLLLLALAFLSVAVWGQDDWVTVPVKMRKETFEACAKTGCTIASPAELNLVLEKAKSEAVDKYKDDRLDINGCEVGKT